MWLNPWLNLLSGCNAREETDWENAKQRRERKRRARLEWIHLSGNNTTDCQIYPIKCKNCGIFLVKKLLHLKIKADSSKQGGSLSSPLLVIPIPSHPLSSPLSHSISSLSKREWPGTSRPASRMSLEESTTGLTPKRNTSTGVDRLGDTISHIW